MIFLSAQPDDTFFIWQLQVLTQNLKDLGVERDSVKILIGYKEELNNEWFKWLNTIHGEVYFYKDEREQNMYLSSIRPHIIKKFFRENPKYIHEYVFYHDADIYFKELPCFECMEDDRIHVSNTKGYTGYVTYIKSKGLPKLEEDLRNSVGISEELLIKNEDNVGGAQYYFKGLGYDFWDKVEKDCENMYLIYHKNLHLYRAEYKVKNNNDLDFQIWTTDMWCVQWNMFLLEKVCYANPELDFSWPSFNINTTCKIFHNSGKDNSNFLDKGEFKKEFPYGKIYHLNPKTDNGEEAIQSLYVKAIIKKGEELGFPRVDIVINQKSYIYVSTNFSNLAKVITDYYFDTVKDKELILYNIGYDNINIPSFKVYNTRVNPFTNRQFETIDEAVNVAQGLALYDNKIIIR